MCHLVGSVLVSLGLNAEILVNQIALIFNVELSLNVLDCLIHISLLWIKYNSVIRVD